MRHSWLPSFARYKGRASQGKSDPFPPFYHQQVALRQKDFSGLSDLSSLFVHQKKTFWMEIGFGHGEHFIAQDLRHPSVGFIGCEPYIDGVLSVLKQYKIHPILEENLRIWEGDVRILMRMLPKNSIDRIDILFPDPWPKRKQQKRRLVQESFLLEIAEILAPGGILHMATDDTLYAETMRAAIDQCPHMVWDVESQASPHCLPTDWVETRYYQKAVAQGKMPYFFKCVKSTPVLAALE